MYYGAISNNELLLLAPCGEQVDRFVWDGAAHKITDEANIERKGINLEATWVTAYYSRHGSAGVLHTPRGDEQEFILLYTMHNRPLP
jgi:hypothetical protein